MSVLFDLHKKYDSIKVRKKYPQTWPYVTRIYPRYLDPLRNQPLKILEIGIAYGGGLKAMRDYMPHAQLVGFDVSLDQVNRENLHNITLIQGDQADVVALTQLIANHGPFDIVIDDACHLYEKQLVTLNTLWPAVNPGGFFFIEDVFTMYGKRGNASSEIFHHIKRELLKEEAFAAKHHTGDIACIAFHNMLICLEKK